MKTCSKCKIEKPLNQFSKDNTSKDGYQYNCKACRNKYYKKNKDRIILQIKNYRESNTDSFKAKTKKYYDDNKDKILARQREYYHSNKEKINVQKKKWYKANKCKISSQKKHYGEINRKKLTAYQTKYIKQRLQTDYLFKLKAYIRTRTYVAFKNKGYSKHTKTQKMLGVDWEIAKKHIERQFKKGMSWDNHGEWHIDHIIPLASANTEQRLKELCHYSNLQPLWATDNISKSDKINGQQTKIRI